MVNITDELASKKLQLFDMQQPTTLTTQDSHTHTHTHSAG